MFRALSPLLERLGECGSCVVYRMGVGLEGREGRCIMGGGGERRSSFEGENAIKSLKASHNQSL